MRLEPELLQEAGYEGIWSERQKCSVDWWYTTLFRVGPVYVLMTDQYESLKDAGAVVSYFDSYEEAVAEYKKYV